MHIFKNLSLSVIFILLLSILYSNQTYGSGDTKKFCTTFDPAKEILSLNTMQNIIDEMSSTNQDMSSQFYNNINNIHLEQKIVSGNGNDITAIATETENIVHTTTGEHQSVVSSSSYESPLPSPRENRCPQTPKFEYNFNKHKSESRFGFYEKLETFDFCKQASSELPKAKNDLLGNSDDYLTRTRSESCSFFTCKFRLLPERQYIIEYLLFNERLPKKVIQKHDNKYNTCVHGCPIVEHNHQHDTFSMLEQNL